MFYITIIRMECVFKKIESIIDQLIFNAQLLDRIGFDEAFGDEATALHKAQESLICKLLGIHEKIGDQSQAPEMERIEEKLSAFQMLNYNLVRRAYTR